MADLLGFEALVMTASAVGVGSRKEGKPKRPRASKEILLRYYMRLRLGSQELCVYLGIERLRRDKPISWNFGIKPFYPKIGGMCLHQNLGERTWELTGFQDCANQGGLMSVDSDTTLESGLLG